jgi:hypothetical protein
MALGKGLGLQIPAGRGRRSLLGRRGREKVGTDMKSSER